MKKKKTTTALPSKREARLLLVVSDTHCGGETGLMPPEVELDCGNVVGIGKNVIQQWLWSEWVAGLEWAAGIIGFDPFVLLINGDATEGIHHRSTQVIASNLERHVQIAQAALAPYLERADQKLVVEGTECHTHGAEHVLAERIGARTGRAHAAWRFEMHGCLVDARHHMPSAIRPQAEGSAMSNDLTTMRANCARAGHRTPSVLLRAHRHQPGMFSDGDGLLLVTGPWQGHTRHAHKVVPNSICRPSVALLDWRHSAAGSLPTVHHRVSRSPQPEVDRI